MIELPPHINAVLVFADGKSFYGRGIGYPQDVLGEVCFNTSMTGYQEILTDPSYTGQIINFTFPHIGNVGTNDIDIEGNAGGAVGLITGEILTEDSNYRSQSSLNDWLVGNEITGICGLDTREITNYVREKGAQNVVISYRKSGNEFDVDALRQKAASHINLKGLDLAEGVSTSESYNWNEALYEITKNCGKSNNLASAHIVAIDFGVKLNILRHFAELGCKVTVVNAKTSADDILALNPDGVFLSNGPGDPAATGKYAVPTIKSLIAADMPIFGICLGHQMLSIALGCETTKMEKGHRGANHPVQNLSDNVVEITSQNHGFVVRDDVIPSDVAVEYRSLFDNTIEGISLRGKKVFSVQHHPEASPGPQDSAYLFKQFVDML